jgi:hypothetical protein
MTLRGDGAARRFCVFIRILHRCLEVSEKVGIFAGKYNNRRLYEK